MICIPRQKLFSKNNFTAWRYVGRVPYQQQHLFGFTYLQFLICNYKERIGTKFLWPSTDGPILFAASNLVYRRPVCGHQDHASGYTTVPSDSHYVMYSTNGS